MGSLRNQICREIIPRSFKKNTVTSFDDCFKRLKSTREDEHKIEGEMGMPLPPFVSKFSKSELRGHLLAIADEDGKIQLVNSRAAGNRAIIKEWCAHSNAVFDIAWIDEKPQLATASADHTARLWDLEKVETIAIFRGHTCSLKSISAQPGSGHVFGTGARDGNIMIWDTRCYMRNGYFGSINTISNAHGTILKQAQPVTRRRNARRHSMLQADSRQSVTAVVFQKDNIVISSGACDGTLKMWDLRRSYSSFKGDPIPMHTIMYPGKSTRQHGYSCLTLDSSSLQLFATCTNNSTYMYDCATLPVKPVAEFTGNTVSTFYVKSSVSPDNMYLLSGSSDYHAYIWKINKPSQSPWTLQGHTAEVTSLDWCPSEINKIVTCADDNSFRIWRTASDDHDHKDMSTNVIGFCEPPTLSNPEEDLEAQSSSAEEAIVPSLRNGCIITNFRCMLENVKGIPIDNAPSKLPVSTTGFATSPSTPKLKKLFMRDVSNLMTPPNVKTSPSSLPSPQTPRSSRGVMETWLQSPGLSPSLARPLSDSNENSQPTKTKQRRIVKARRGINNNSVIRIANSANKTSSPSQVAGKRKLENASESSNSKSSRRRLDCSSPSQT